LGDRVNKITFYLALLVLLSISGNLIAQSRLKPGHVYQSGDSIYAPLSGIKALVPQYWLGLLPQESRVFTLMSANSTDDNIFVFVREDNIQSISQRWANGVEIDEGINAFLENPAEISEDRIYGEFKQTNDPKARIIGEAQCGFFGKCVIVFALTDTRGIENIKIALKEFTESITFVKPGTEDLYNDFDWPSYLNGKYIFNYQSNQYFRKENHLWMCSDGSFTTSLKRKGVLKEEAEQYKGKKKGTYLVTGKGKYGKIVLEFKGAPTLEIDTEIRDDKVYINGFQFFVTDHNTCK